MAYFLRQEKKKQRIYLQMYENYWDKQKKQPRTKHIETFGYVDELISDEMPDPIAHFQAYVKERETLRLASQAEETRPRAFSKAYEKYAGHFLLDTLLSELNVKEDMDILASPMRFQFSVYDLIAQLIFARVICPCSKSKNCSFCISVSVPGRANLGRSDL